ncbi:MAG TPA: hypothetical protein IAA33_02595, partial [Candidatus Helicobacter avicola]|nr:hypothetical protein [Candidatus Helicobacter avicola]
SKRTPTMVTKKLLANLYLINVEMVLGISKLGNEILHAQSLKFALFIKGIVKFIQKFKKLL